MRIRKSGAQGQNGGGGLNGGLNGGGPIFEVEFPIPFDLFRFGAMVWDFSNKHALHKNGVDDVKSDKFGA